MSEASLNGSEAEIQTEMLGILSELGWSILSRKEMSDLRGRARMNEAIVEPLLVKAILRLNDGLAPEEAQQIAAQVRRISSDREMLQVLRSGIPYKPAPDVPTRDVIIVDLEEPSRNSFVATEEFSILTGGVRNPRLDVVCLINGLPLGVIENKGTSHGLDEAASDWAGYWTDVPQLIAQSSVVGCCNGLEFVVGPSGGRSLSGYIDWTDAWPHTAADPDDPMLVGLTGAYAPETLLDLAANFVVFETRSGATTKKLARAHQFRAANKIVARVREGIHDRGIVWHATGSGKSLTMVFAARKLLRAGLGNPTVLIVIDRTELDEQISDTLLACEFDGVARAASREELGRLLRAGGGGVIVSTVQKFDEGLADALPADNVITFVDECHRTQFRQFGIWMRKALPNASLFGFSGTPIELDGRSTRGSFSPRLEGGELEPYLDRYGFDQAIADGATVPVVYEARLSEWRIAGADLDDLFESAAADLDEEDRERLRREATRESVIAKAPARVKAVAADIAEQLERRIAPSGFGAQLVATDREACALYAEALGTHLQPDEFAVIMSRSKKDADRRAGAPDLRRWYPAAQWQRIHGRPIDDNGEGAADDEDEFTTASDRAAIRDLIARFKNPDDPLKLLIVNSMLITGFDAPVEEALFLDRGLRGHTLIQAIARTNRRYPGKDRGLIIDYWGVFEELQGALSEFASEDLEGLAEDTDALYGRFPHVLENAKTIVAEAPPASAARRRMLWVMRRFQDRPEEAERFEGLVREAQSIFESLSPDPRLAPHLAAYGELLDVWLAHQRGIRRGPGELGELRAKTIAMVQGAIEHEGIRDDIPALTIDADYLRELEAASDLSAEEKATDIEAAIVHEIKVRGEDDPLAKTLVERLANLRSRRSREVQLTLDDLRQRERIVREYVEAKAQSGAIGLGGPGEVAWQALQRALPSEAPQTLAPIAERISERFGEVAGFHGWPERPDVLQGLRKGVLRELARDPLTRPLAVQGQVVDEILAGLIAGAQ